MSKKELSERAVLSLSRMEDVFYYLFSYQAKNPGLEDRYYKPVELTTKIMRKRLSIPQNSLNYLLINQEEFGLVMKTTDHVLGESWMKIVYCLTEKGLDEVKELIREGKEKESDIISKYYKERRLTRNIIEKSIGPRQKVLLYLKFNGTPIKKENNPVAITVAGISACINVREALVSKYIGEMMEGDKLIKRETAKVIGKKYRKHVVQLTKKGEDTANKIVSELQLTSEKFTKVMN